MRIGIYGGGFKPFTTGHYSKLILASEENDLVVLFYGVSERMKGSEYRYSREMAEEVFTIVGPAIERELPNVRVIRGKPTPIALTYDAIADWLGIADTKLFKWSSLGVRPSDITHITVYGGEDDLVSYTQHIDGPKENAYFSDSIKTGRLTFDTGITGGIKRSLGTYARRHKELSPEEIGSREAVRGTEVRAALMSGDPSKIEKFMPPILNDAEREQIKLILLRGVPTSESLIRSMIRGFLVN